MSGLVELSHFLAHAEMKVSVLPPGSRVGPESLADVHSRHLPSGLRALSVTSTLVETEERIFPELQEQVVGPFLCLLTSKD